MQKILSFLLLISISLSALAQSDINEILEELDKELKESKYTKQKEQRITDFKLRLLENNNAEEKYKIKDALFQEYRTFKTDSAIKYVKEKQNIAQSLNQADLISECKLQLSYLYSITGMYIESNELLNQLQKEKLNAPLKSGYYEARKTLYTTYNKQNPNSSKYASYTNLYRDSLLYSLNPNSNHYKTVLAEKLQFEGNFKEAKDILFSVLNNVEDKSHQHAIVTSAIGNLFKKEGDVENAKKYFALSALSDIKNAIKENTSLQSLALVLFDSGDIQRSYQYSKHSMEDAIFCNAPLRTLEISRLYPIIDSAYQQKVEKQKQQLLLYLTLISFLSIGLIIAIIYAVNQVKKLARNRKELQYANKQLQLLNKDLQAVNIQLKTTNTKLSDANRVKEEYIGNFLDLCSSYINKLEDYRKMLHKKASTGKTEELFTILKSNNLIESELRQLYKNFDNIFLHLYPNFIEEFNKLLLDEEHFTIKADEILNTELRIFALIRLGINDSSRIASFLRYSASTIYNYRTKVRNKAGVPRENFENLVMEIGSPK